MIDMLSAEDWPEAPQPPNPRVDRFAELEKRVAALENRGAYRIKLSKVQQANLQAGDTLVVSMAAPLADSERKRFTDGFQALLTETGHPDVSVVLITGGTVELGVIRS